MPAPICGIQGPRISQVELPYPNGYAVTCQVEDEKLAIDAVSIVDVTQAEILGSGTPKDDNVEVKGV